jgi:hypothetical protein
MPLTWAPRGSELAELAASTGTEDCAIVPYPPPERDSRRRSPRP